LLARKNAIKAIQADAPWHYYLYESPWHSMCAGQGH